MARGEGRYWGFVGAWPAPVLTAAARQAEAQGLAGVFAPQVYGPPWTALAAAAAVTERIQIASGIAIAATRSPFETAMAAIDLDRLSGGRFVLGLGASVLSWTRGLYGAPPHKPLAHLRETVAAVRHIVRGAHRGLQPFEGRYYRADFAALQPTEPPLREEIPIWIAALRERAVRLAGEVADGLMGHPMWSIPWATERMPRALGKGLRRSGRERKDFEVNLWLWAAPNPDEAEAIEDSRATVAFYAGIEQYEPFFEAHGFRDPARCLQRAVAEHRVREAAREVSDEMVRTFVLAGRPEELRDRLAKVWEVADSVCLVPPFYGLSPEKAAYYNGMIAQTFYPG